MSDCTYVGDRRGTGYPDRGAPAVYVVDQGGIRALRHVVKHSPTGLEWGYQGSGPADLALSILVDALGEDPEGTDLKEERSLAWAMHRDFKDQRVALFPHEGWQLSGADVMLWVEEWRARRSSRREG